jgi:hypothetical protein
MWTLYGPVACCSSKLQLVKLRHTAQFNPSTDTVVLIPSTEYLQYSTGTVPYRRYLLAQYCNISIFSAEPGNILYLVWGCAQGRKKDTSRLFLQRKLTSRSCRDALIH